MSTSAPAKPVQPISLKEGRVVGQVTAQGRGRPSNAAKPVTSKA